MLQRITAKVFEFSVGVFIVLNGLLTLFPGSVVRDNLWNLIGFYSVAVPVFQIIAGLMKLIGIVCNKVNVEVAGLVGVSSIFLIRIMALVMDGDVSLSDINNIVIAVLIIFANAVSIAHSLLGYVILYVKRSNVHSL